MAPGMRKRTREGTRSPGYQIFCSHPEVSGVLARMMIGLKPRAKSAVQLPERVELTTSSTGVVPMYSPFSSMTKPDGQLRMSIVLTGSAVLTSGSGAEAQADRRMERRRIGLVMTAGSMERGARSLKGFVCHSRPRGRSGQCWLRPVSRLRWQMADQRKTRPRKQTSHGLTRVDTDKSPVGCGDETGNSKS